MAAWRKLLSLLRRGFARLLGGRAQPLCDTCRYDHPHSCRRPERPNAFECPDYKRR